MDSARCPNRACPTTATKWECELREEQTLDGPACTATVPLSGVRRGVRGRASLQGLECCDHWFQGLGAPVGFREGRGVGGDPSLSSPILLPTPRCWEAQAHPFKSAWESPGPPSLARAETSKRPLRDPVAEGAGWPWGRWLRWAPFHPGWEPTPSGGRSGLLRVPAGQRREDLGLQSRTELCDLRKPLLVSGLGFSSCLPP